MSAVRLSDAVLNELEQVCERRKFRPGEKITEKGEKPASLYFVLTGWVDIRFLEDRSELQGLRVGERSVLGEMSFLSGETAVATAIAVGPVTVLEVDQTSLDKLKTMNPQAAAEFSQYLVNTMDRRLHS